MGRDGRAPRATAPTRTQDLRLAAGLSPVASSAWSCVACATGREDPAGGRRVAGPARHKHLQDGERQAAGQRVAVPVVPAALRRIPLAPPMRCSESCGSRPPGSSA